MNRALSAVRLDPGHIDWPVRLREMRRRLAERPTLLPHHFLEVVLPKIGGECFTVVPSQAGTEEVPCGYAFLLPRGARGEGQEYTLRYEHVAGFAAVGDGEIVKAVEEKLQPGQRTCFYRADGDHTFTATHIDLEGIDCGRPNASEAAAIREMQHAIWHSPPDGLYPSDLHSDEAGLGCSLVARVDGALAAFLLGFHRFSPVTTALPLQNYNRELMLESQLLAVAPGRRRRRIGQLLKRLQAREALAAGVDLISWTTDPLLFANALLNFTRLGAVACEFQPSFYPFRNELNRLNGGATDYIVAGALAAGSEGIAGRSAAGTLRRRGRPGTDCRQPGSGAPVFDAACARIAIEIPGDWVALQRLDWQAAQRWRDTTTRLLDHYIGSGQGEYSLQIQE